MTSPSPLQPGQYCHIYHRGNNGEDVFLEERNYRHLLRQYAKHIEPVADTYAYCLLRNHFHLLVWIKTVEEQEAFFQEALRVSKTPRVLKEKNPSQQFGNLFNAYAKAVNKAYGRTGSLFEHPFGRKRVSSNAYLAHLVAYIHRNPQKHGFVDDWLDWPYSSYHAMLSEKTTRLKRADVLGWFDGFAQFEAFYREEVNEGLIAPLVADDRP